MAVDDAGPLRHVRGMATTKLDLTGLKCPLPALKTRKALKALKPGDFLEVHCTDPLSVIDIPNLIRETGDKVEITERAERRIVFLIEKANRPWHGRSFTVTADAVRRCTWRTRYLLPIDTAPASVPIELSAGVRRSSCACRGHAFWGGALLDIAPATDGGHNRVASGVRILECASRSWRISKIVRSSNVEAARGDGLRKRDRRRQTCPARAAAGEEPMTTISSAGPCPAPEPGILDREHTIAKAGFNRWLVPPAALCIHLCIGMAYGFSVFWLPLSRAIGLTAPKACPDMSLVQELFTTTCDWKVASLGWMFTLFFVVLGVSAAIWGGWLERVGPRKAGFVAALCWAGGLLIGALGIYVHQLWIMWLGAGVIGGIGLGLGYISPVSTLIKWFPDRRGMATGMAIMGFGGGAMIGAPLANILMNYFKTPTSVGVWRDLRRAWA